MTMKENEQVTSQKMTYDYIDVVLAKHQKDLKRRSLVRYTVFPIAIIVLSSLLMLWTWGSLLLAHGSLTPLFTGLTFRLMIVGLVLFLVNKRDQKKVLSIVAFGVSVGMLILSGSATAVATWRNYEDYEDNVLSRTWSPDWANQEASELATYVDESVAFTRWSEKDLTDLTYGESKGTSVDAIIDQFGKAQSGYLSQDQLELMYVDPSSQSQQVITLWFKRNSDDEYLLLRAEGENLSNESIKVQDAATYTSNWTQSDVDALALQKDQSQSHSGSKLTDILAKHGQPTSIQTLVDCSSNGTTHQLSVAYVDQSVSKGYLATVNLEFEEVDGTYYLTQKSTADDTL